jgi:hypothetical protein
MKKQVKFVVLSPEEISDLELANKSEDFLNAFSEKEINDLKSGNNVSLSSVILAKKVIDQFRMKRIVASTEFVERVEMERYVSRIEFKVIQDALDNLILKFFLTFKLLEKSGLVSEEALMEISNEIDSVISEEVKPKRGRKKKK